LHQRPAAFFIPDAKSFFPATKKVFVSEENKNLFQFLFARRNFVLFLLDHVFIPFHSQQGDRILLILTISVIFYFRRFLKMVKVA
jgi:uncharacterized membrane protein